jgi:hypothetical protein
VLTAEFTVVGVTRMLEEIRPSDPVDRLLSDVFNGDARKRA